MRTKIINNLSAMNKFAGAFVKKLRLNNQRAAVIGLQGNLGSGKTTFVQCVAKILEIEQYITSPTFVIQKKYKVNKPGINFVNLIHIDAYRLNSGEELARLGWREIAANPKNIIFIEWPKRVEEILPSDAIKLHFEFIDEQTRKISYK
ncbi:MAG: tRNA (adenosine(37)-N6)-threonylcarbamoyltransferase complex ATPase subunit type 1 TsaE [Candidatus Pacebacteria bacterium]|nr:tRNA (adenosine(37)-N6)-threonylcarbamoyltransferase complex ATPase subunit type 1 TsaE [Candidatus Paceibacterota bacterium]